MLCTHCRHSAALLGGHLCANCAAARPPVPPGTRGGLLVGAPPAVAPLHTPQGRPWLRSPVALGNATAALLGFVVATDLFALFADFVMRDVTSRLTGVVDAGVQRDADRADTLYAVAGVAQVAAVIATVVVFLVWFQRTRVNAEVFAPHGHRKARAWTCWGWFVPVVNLWYPHRIMADVWDASSERLHQAGHGLINSWWAFWVVSMFADRIAFAAYRDAETAAEIHAAVAEVMFADAVDMVAAALAIVVVVRLTRMQDRKTRLGPVPVGV